MSCRFLIEALDNRNGKQAGGHDNRNWDTVQLQKFTTAPEDRNKGFGSRDPYRNP